MSTVALVSCVKAKRTGSWPAQDLYRSPLFRLSREYAERNAARWYVLSARYGLLAHDEVVECYDETLTGMTAPQRRDWARRVAEQIHDRGAIQAADEVVWLAGSAYSRELGRLLQGVKQSDPMKGLAIGKRLAWLNRQIGRVSP